MLFRSMNHTVRGMSLFSLAGAQIDIHRVTVR
jgi:hypothetical protein